ncbi:hypothetical protein [Inquilinus limosus]|uniref:hypothetical protein n=1 Tax=Inquilinus limosus TaxID=171674 RepID=UPI00126A3529|nr:hypothetical protein [Inquilinus limosus]
MDDEISDFAHGLATLDLTELECAIGLLWFLESTRRSHEASPRELGTLMHDLSLRGQVNISRLAGRLANSRDVVKGKAVGTYKLRLGRKDALAERFEAFLTHKTAKVQPHIVDPSDFVGTRRYLESLTKQINGSYQYGFYDGCAALCRRLMESLLIEAFEQNGHGSAIKQDGHYVQLNEIVGMANSGKYIKLSRGSGREIEIIKSVGDTAAHSRNYSTKKSDIDDLKHAFRRIVTELAHLAKIEPRKDPQNEP